MHLLGVRFGQGAWKLWQGTSDCRVGSRTGNVCVGTSVFLVELAFGRLARLLRVVAKQGTQPVRFEACHYGVTKYDVCAAPQIVSKLNAIDEMSTETRPPIVHEVS